MMNNAALDALRNLFRSARSGKAIDARTLVAAVSDAVNAGHDVRPCLTHFSAFASVRLDCVRGVDAAALARSAREHGGWKAAIVVASLLNWSDAWAAAMTAHYGPASLHESRCDANGRPTAETLAAFPDVAARMADAADRWERLVSYYERNDGETRWEYVVEMKRAA